MKKHTQQLDKYVETINKGLNAYLEVNKNMSQKIVVEAMRYSTLYGGKRLRGVLTLAFCKLVGGRIEDALPFACAIEMIHSYSLIHDDLPSMDNDDYRRGQPSNHIEYGEANAILAGDALLTKAFEIIGKSQLPAKNIVEAVVLMANQAGIEGMIGGQIIDLESEIKPLSEEGLKELQLLKTGALISASATLGCIAGDASSDMKSVAKIYGQNLGLAFQITDDILDDTSTKELLGKPAGSDKKNNKVTFVSKYGLEKAREKADFYTNKATDSLEIFDQQKKDFLMYLTETLLNRKK